VTIMSDRTSSQQTSRVLTSMIVAAFIAGGAAVRLQIWWLFWVSAAVILLGIPAERGLTARGN
jgi:hypothetical protein